MSGHWIEDLTGCRFAHSTGRGARPGLSIQPALTKYMLSVYKFMEGKDHSFDFLPFLGSNARLSIDGV